MQVAMHDVCGLRSRCRGSAIPDVATYRRVSVLDVASCAKTGSFKPSINLSADHETGLAEPKLRQHRRKENPPKREPAGKRTRQERTHAKPNDSPLPAFRARFQAREPGAPERRFPD